jgi:hypothetical protein
MWMAAQYMIAGATGPFRTIHDFHRHLQNDVEAHTLNARPGIQGAHRIP